MNDECELVERRCRSVEMLRAVIDGDPYAVVSARWGVSRTAVERRVKRLAAHLTRVVGVEGLKVDGVAFVKRLRMRREAILAALDRFDPAQMSNRNAARVHSVQEVELGALRVRSRSNRPLHDLALYHLLFASGLRPLEVARLEVADYLTEDGNVRRESCVRAEVAINGKARPLFFGHRRLDEALDAYLSERLRDGGCEGVGGRWRGLDPGSRLFVTADGQPYAITSPAGVGHDRHVCRMMLEACRRIFRYADIGGMTAQSARLTLMSRMYERGADEDQVGLLLGIADRSAVRAQLARPRPQLLKLLEDPA